MPPVLINIVAACSNSGKTTLIEGLIPELIARGLRVAALKGNIHHYTLDLPGKDTWRFTRAGAEAAGMISDDRYILTGPAPGKSGLGIVRSFLKELDLILIEGDKQSTNPKIEVIRGALQNRPVSTQNLIAVVTDLPDLTIEVPRFDLDDYPGLATFLMEQLLQQSPPRRELTHFDPSGRPRMVDVSAKPETTREAYARGEIIMAPSTLQRIKEGSLAKGDVLGVAQVAAIMAIKETGRLIPMAHPLPIAGAEVEFNLQPEHNRVEIGVKVRVTGQTGVEMEALTGVSVAALTIYDMCKAIDKEMTIQNIRLIEKRGGRSGHWRREP
ncbi:MAG: cyclic pyranopterin monophosphate synthase MoaC [Firmicutes bacterium]|nr:cyclic pyranopterin monophosphate synthase MoaC [Bacillota bacterium]